MKKPQPLAGITVLDLSRVLAGPWCTQQLADLGAEVIKIERPSAGDDTRGWGPPWLAGTDESAYFQSANRGKQSVAVDFSDPQGAAIVRELAANADVVVENFKVGGLSAYGLDYDTLAGANPALVYCSITGFGQTGPYAHRAGYDFLIQAMGGVMSVTGQPEGEPMKAGVAVADIFTGLYGANAILAALRTAEATGQGTHIDMALLDVQIAVMANQAASYLATGQNPPRLGNAHPSIVPYQVFPTADEPLIIAVGNDGQFAKLCQALDRAELATDPRFATNAARVEHRGAIVDKLSARLRDKPRAEWLDILEAAGVPCGPINTLDQVFADPHVIARDMTLRTPHPAGLDIDLVANPMCFGAQRPMAESAPPLLGQHTDDVLGAHLGYNAAQLADLAERDVIGRCGHE